MVNEEHLAIVKHGVASWNKWRKQNPHNKINLREARLRGLDLHRIDFTDANLSGSDLSGANLRGAHLNRVNLNSANLSGADLYGAQLRGANLRKADLRGADLRKADLTGADLSLANFRGADLFGTRLVEAKLSKADFTDANVIKRRWRPRPSETHVAGNQAAYGPPLSMKPITDDVYFRAIYPEKIKSEVWQTLLVYAHVMSAIEAVHKDAQRFIDELPTLNEIALHQGTRIARGTEITVIPSCQGLVFNPEYVVFKWMENYHRTEFRFSAKKLLANDVAKILINVSIGPLVVGRLKLPILINETDQQVPIVREQQKRMYRQQDIFVSYSHKDTPIVIALKEAYNVLGFNTLRDIDTLRAGQIWNEELMSLIDRASIFQLFWSKNSARSKYCKQEWEHALKQNRDDFIRPFYWENPMPKPPRKLSKFHFAHLQMDRLKGPFEK